IAMRTDAEANARARRRSGMADAGRLEPLPVSRSTGVGSPRCCNLSRPDLVVRTIRSGAKYVMMVPARPRVRHVTFRATVYLAKARSTWFPPHFRTHPHAYGARRFRPPTRCHDVSAIWSGAGTRARSAR